MKKFYLVLLALISLSASVFADGLTATLQQGDVMTPFYGVDAFKDAYAAAKDGAVITLSPGNFNTVPSIEKQITIIGAYAFGDKSSERTSFASDIIRIGTNNVKIEGVYFNSNVNIGVLSKDTLKNCTFKRCRLPVLSNTISGYHQNTLVDQCVIEDERAVYSGIDYCIKNSTIGHFSNNNPLTGNAYITNCVVWEWVNYNSNFSKQPTAIYKNNMLGIYIPNFVGRDLKLYSPSEFYNNRFFSSNKGDYLGIIEIDYGTCVDKENAKEILKFNKYFEYPAHPIDAPLGSDGTPIGPYGGTGFSEYPAIPRITSKTIDANSDAEGKINVKITVKAE